MDFFFFYCLVYTLFIPLLFDRTGLLLVLLTCPSTPSEGVSGPGPPCVSHHLRFPNALQSRSLDSICHTFGQPLSGFGRGGHMSHSESSLPEYLLIGLHLRYSRQVSLITFISQYGFGLVGFRIWLVVWTSRPIDRQLLGASARLSWSLASALPDLSQICSGPSGPCLSVHPLRYPACSHVPCISTGRMGPYYGPIPMPLSIWLAN